MLVLFFNDFLARPIQSSVSQCRCLIFGLHNVLMPKKPADHGVANKYNKHKIVKKKTCLTLAFSPP